MELQQCHHHKGSFGFAVSCESKLMFQHWCMSPRRSLAVAAMQCYDATAVLTQGALVVLTSCGCCDSSSVHGSGAMIGVCMLSVIRKCIAGASCPIHVHEVAI